MQRHWSVYMSELSGGGPCNDGDGPPLQPLAYLTSMPCRQRLGPSLLQDSVVRIRMGDWAYRADLWPALERAQIGEWDPTCLLERREEEDGCQECSLTAGPFCLGMDAGVGLKMDAGDGAKVAT